MSDRMDGYPPVEQIECWRDRSWVFVALDGEVVWKRLTRDRAFTRARVGFYANRSPQVPKSREAFETVHLLGSWRPGCRARWSARNGIDVPVLTERGVVWTRFGGVQPVNVDVTLEPF